jgi:DNA-binding NarL/FixJ family response regulator
VDNPAWAPWRGLTARALHALGRFDEAIALAEEEVAQLRGWGAATSLGPALRLLGELRGATGTAELREAVELLSTTDSALELARARIALGRSPEVADQEALPLLESALRGARACGARRVARDAIEALVRRGHAPNEGEDAPTRLTTRQQRVTDLAASGLDVNEVAQRLFLTPGTVRAVLESTTEARS